jgi:hypothetical protein
MTSKNTYLFTIEIPEAVGIVVTGEKQKLRVLECKHGHDDHEQTDHGKTG